MAVFNACAAIFWSMGNAKISMKISFVMNLMDIKYSGQNHFR